VFLAMSPAMRRAARALAMALVLGSTAPAPPAAAAEIESLGVSYAERLPRVRPDYPVPNDPGQAFYLQRSTNPNTIVYALRFDAQGDLDRRRPVHAYWRRFNNQGQAAPLKAIERRFAYGVAVRRQGPGAFRVWLRPLPEIPIELRQTGPFEASVTVRIGGRPARPVYGYFQVDDSGLIPRIARLSLHGYDLATGRAITERFRVGAGGEIGQ